MKRTRILSNVFLRALARTLVHARPYLLGHVSEAYEGPFRIRPFGLPLKYHLGAADAVGNILLWCGPRRFEPDVLPVFTRLARSARGIMDIGANTGIYSLIACAANPQCRVIAWEPVPHLFLKLRNNILLNDFAGRCEVRQAALSDHNGRATLYVPADTTMASLNSSFGNHPTSAIEVDVATVDDTVPPDFPVDLIKLDVESHEYSVLCGMRGLLARHHPLIIFECLPGTPPEPIERLLRDLGYRFFRLDRSGPVAIERLGSNEGSVNHNFVAGTRDFV